MSRMNSKRNLGMMGLALALASALWAQNAASIRGLVKDQNGAPVEKARVELTAAGQAAKRVAETGVDGTFSFLQLEPGSYRLTAACENCSDETAATDLGVGQARQITMQLTKGSSASVISQGGRGITADLSSTRTGANITAAEVGGLPINGRSYALLLLGAPGITVAGSGSFDQFRANGKSTEQNKFTFDGIDASSVFDASPGWLAVTSSSPFRLQTSVETIQELAVDTALAPAESGTGAGARISLQSKSGGEQWHGTAYQFLRNEAFASPNFFDQGRRPAVRMNHWGGNVGGPLRKEKAYLFVGAEALRQKTSQQVRELVPSAAARARALPAVRPLVELFPAGMARTSNPDLDEVTRQPFTRVNEWNLTSRLDYNVSAASKLTLRYIKAGSNLQSPDNSVTGRQLYAGAKPDNTMAAWTSAVGANGFNDLRFGLNRAPSNVLSRAPVGALDGIALDGGSGLAMLGGLSRQSSAGAGSGSDYRGKTVTLMDNFTWQRGRHNLKMGGEYRQVRVPMNQYGGTTYTFNNLNALLNNASATVNYIADLGFHEGRQNYYIGYLQDEWRLGPTLTVNAGLRYENYSPNREVNNRARLFDVARLDYRPGGSAFYGRSNQAWGPRLGVSWAPARWQNRLVVRAGAGFYYGPGQYEDLVQPIENDGVRLRITGVSYPYDVRQATGLAPQTPRGYDVDGMRIPERNLQYGASVEGMVGYGILARVGYVGSQGRNLFFRSIANQITGVDPANGRVTRQNNTFGEIDYKTSGGADQFNALQLGAARRFADGMTLSANYMWAHSLGTSQGSNEASTAQNPNCFRCERGSNNFDIRHSAAVSVLYDLPLGAGRQHLNRGWIAHLAGGWSAGGSFTGRSGLPLNVTLSRSDVVYIDPVTRAVVATATNPPAGSIAVANLAVGGSSRSSQRPDLVAGVNPYLKNGRHWLNPAAFAAPAVGRYGNLGRNTLRGPALIQGDLVATRTFKMGEQHRLDFRVEVFNLTNRTNFANPAAVLPNVLRTLQPGQAFGLDTAPGFGELSSTVGRTTGLGTARQAQFSLRYSF